MRTREGGEVWVALFTYPVAGDASTVWEFVRCRRTIDLFSRYDMRDLDFWPRSDRFEFAIILPVWVDSSAAPAPARAEWSRYLDWQRRSALGDAVMLADAYSTIAARTSAPGSTTSIAQAQQEVIPAFEAYQRCTCGGRCVDRCASLPAMLERTRWVPDRAADEAAKTAP